MINIVNKILSRLPFLGKKGIFIDFSNRYFLVKPKLLRGSRSGQGVIVSYFLGNEIVELIKTHTDFKNNICLLDAGCGDGRVAAALSRMNFKGKYVGFDINKYRINALLHFFKNNKNYNFNHADIFHSYYNKNGKIKPEEYNYPYGNNRFDLVIYNSIFSHQKFQVIKKNLLEAKRVLKTGGKIWCTFYLKDKNYNQGEENPSKRYFDTTYDKGFTAVPEKH